MNWIIIFLGFIAVAEVGRFILDISNKSLQREVNILLDEINRERDQYNENRKEFEKEATLLKDARDLWSKKYFELEILLKKEEYKENKGE